MATLTITINTSDGAAMADDPIAETVDVLHRLADRIQTDRVVPNDTATIYDVNGGRVGTAVWID